MNAQFGKKSVWIGKTSFGKTTNNIYTQEEM